MGKSRKNTTDSSLTLIENKNKQIVVDVADCIAGRVCSYVSKLLLEGNRVAIINSERAMLSGNRYQVIEDYKKRLEIGSITNPIHGPYHPRRPDRIITKMIRGMVPRNKPTGLAAFRKLRVYIGTPIDLQNSKIKRFDDTRITKSESYYITIGDVAKQIGWKSG